MTFASCTNAESQPLYFFRKLTFICLGQLFWLLQNYDKIHLLRPQRTIPTRCLSKHVTPFTQAFQQLRLNQRENIAWERDTVCRQMIGTDVGLLDQAGAVLVVPPEPVIVEHRNKFENPPFRDFEPSNRSGNVIFIALLNVCRNGQEANRCFSILSFCTILWATEVSRDSSS